MTRTSPNASLGFLTLTYSSRRCVNIVALNSNGRDDLIVTKLEQ